MLVWLAFRKKDSTKYSPANYGSIFYHEDDYRQVEIVPFENFNALIKQAENIEEFAEKNFDGIGYSDIMVREENELKLKDRGIPVTELEEVLLNLSLPRKTLVTTGISPGEMVSKNTLGYGENWNGLFFQFESDIVSSIWIAGTIPTGKDKVTDTLNVLGRKWNLLLMDWNSCKLIDLKDKEQIVTYLSFEDYGE
ncbi:hypothetical protein MYP_2781 [Sporocytophaga myxococcoides]|uniref:Uncharacterized protein n=2 Tax=Sporocytophaga myxococcoides TaxID=153721 RepID=A0A098LGI6_9BACT|nr:hypothetical protein MYP_2781 [Sporocytophaga myxococcoides]